MLFYLKFLAAWKEVEDVSENGGESSSDESLRKQINLPKVVAIGLQGKKNVGFETLEKHALTYNFLPAFFDDVTNFQ